MSISIPQETNYASIEKAKVVYRYRTLQPLASVVLQTNAPVSAQFELPPIVYNLAKSRLEFNIVQPAGGEGLYNVIQGQSLAPLLSCSVITENGVSLVDSSLSLQPFSKAVLPILTSDSDFNQMNPLASVGTTGFSKANSAVSAMDANSPLGVVYKPTVGSNPLVVNFSDIENARVGAINTAQTTAYSIPLNMIKHSILSMPQDLYFGGLKLTLTFNFDATNNYCFTAGDLNFNGATPLEAGAGSITGLSLRLAQEDNPEVSALLVQKVNSSGLKLAFPQVVESKWTTDASASASNVVHLNISRGSKFLRAYSTQMTNIGTPAGAGRSAFWNNNNNASGLWTTVRDSVNNKYLQDITLSPADAYKFTKDLLKGSCVQTYEQWLNSACVYVQDFSGFSGDELDGRENNDCGLSLTQAVDYQVDWTKATQSQYHFIWCVCQKVLDIKAGTVNVSVM